MFPFRLVTIALCATSVLLLATLQPVRIVMPREAAPSRLALGPCLGPRIEPLTVIDVAPGATASQLDALLHLDSDERITAINDRPLDRSTPPADLFAELPPRAGGYLDLTVSRAASERRILVLQH
jgi:hypothetical protein